jgi:hypothetical protein
MKSPGAALSSRVVLISYHCGGQNVIVKMKFVSYVFVKYRKV